MLLLTLGAECIQCGEDNMSLLTVDHADGITWDRYALRYDARIEAYLREFVEGVRLRALCMPCNGRFGRLSQLQEPGSDEELREPGADEDEPCPDTDFVTEGEDPPF